MMENQNEQLNNVRWNISQTGKPKKSLEAEEWDIFWLMRRKGENGINKS